MSRAKSPDVREGNARGAEELPPGLPTPTAAFRAPAPPRHLDRVGKSVWRRVYEAGGGAYVPATDSWAIERYAELHSRRAKCAELVDRDGIAVAGSQGQLVQHPAAKLLYQTEQQMLALEDRLGLNPEARLRLNIATAQFKSDLDRFMDEGAGGT